MGIAQRLPHSSAKGQSTDGKLPWFSWHGRQKVPLQVHQQQKKDQGKQGRATKQAGKNSDKGHGKAQAIHALLALSYWQHVLLGLSGKSLSGRDVS